MTRRIPRHTSKHSPPADDFAADEALALVMKLLPIVGPSREEGEVARFVTNQLLAAGYDRAQLCFDHAGRRTTPPGEVGNLILKLPGTLPGPRRMLAAHMDTVPLCVGSKPQRHGGSVRSAKPGTGLGADDRAGVAVLLHSALELKRRALAHPPLTFVWLVQEEIGLYGARHIQVAKLGKPALAFNFDGGPAEKLTLGATGAYRMKITIDGIAAHAGGAPEQGVSAIAAAALAIAELQQEGWHGLIRKGKHTGTSNVGVIHGGEATNVVTPRVVLAAEARSHDPAFRLRILHAIERAFQRAARRVRNCHGKSAQVQIESQMDYESFRLSPDDPSAVAAAAAIRAIGREPQWAISNGGLDANWITANGIPTVTLGCGQRHIHTPAEELDLDDFLAACRIARRLTTSTENPAQAPR